MKLLYFKTNNSTFILKDEEIFRRNFLTKTFNIKTSSSFRYIIELVKLILFLLFAGWRFDIYFIRFADWHTAVIAFFTKLYRKKLFVVIGGFDVAAIPELNYGAHLNKQRSRFVKYALNNASYLLPNSNSMVYYENTFIRKKAIYGGIKHFAPETQSKIKVIPNGFDSGFWVKKKGVQKKDIAITVAFVDNDRTFYLKGIDKFILTATKLKEYKFQAVGVSKEYLDKKVGNLPENLEILESATSKELTELYSEAKVFCLFSLSEGMPNVLCESMLCECLPVGTNVTSIPEIIGNTGFIVKKNSNSEYIQNVKGAFLADSNMGEKARERIVSLYHSKLREERLVNILNNK